MVFKYGGRCCSVPMCYNSNRKALINHDTINFHTFPKNQIIFDKWISVLKLNPEDKPSKWALVCSQHFKEDDYWYPTWYSNKGGSRRTLKKSAIPSKYLPLSAHVASGSGYKMQELQRDRSVRTSTLDVAPSPSFLASSSGQDVILEPDTDPLEIVGQTSDITLKQEFAQPKLLNLLLQKPHLPIPSPLESHQSPSPLNLTSDSKSSILNREEIIKSEAEEGTTDTAMTEPPDMLLNETESYEHEVSTPFESVYFVVKQEPSALDLENTDDDSDLDEQNAYHSEIDDFIDNKPLILRKVGNVKAKRRGKKTDCKSSKVLGHASTSMDIDAMKQENSEASTIKTDAAFDQLYPNLFCSFCSKTFSSKLFLIEHFNTNDPDQPCKFSCRFCQISFKGFRELHQHLATHTNDRPFKCSHCSLSFRHAENLNSHVIVHKKEREFQCKECGKAFNYLNNLQQHMVTHLSDKRFCCTQCDKWFKSDKRLKSHLNTHSNVRPFKCTVCDKTYKMSAHLVRHMDTHDD